MAMLSFEVKQHLTGHIKPLVRMQMQAWFQQHKLQHQSCRKKHNSETQRTVTTQMRKTYKRTEHARWDDLQLQNKIKQRHAANLTFNFQAYILDFTVSRWRECQSVHFNSMNSTSGIQ